MTSSPELSAGTRAGRVPVITFSWMADPIEAAVAGPRHAAAPPRALEDHLLAAALHDRVGVLSWECLPGWVRAGKARHAAGLHPALVAAGWTPPPAPPSAHPLLSELEQQGAA